MHVYFTREVEGPVETFSLISAGRLRSEASSMPPDSEAAEGRGH